jgi:hypothetical protein
LNGESIGQAKAWCQVLWFEWHSPLVPNIFFSSFHSMSSRYFFNQNFYI